MTKDDLIAVAMRLNDGKEYGMRKTLFESLKRISGDARLSRRTVDGWFIGRPIERFWQAQIQHLAENEITITDDERIRICQWFKKLDPESISDGDRELFERLN